jgi:hypothetical protein
MQMGRDAAWPGSSQGILQFHVRRELALDHLILVAIVGARCFDAGEIHANGDFSLCYSTGRANSRIPTGILTLRSRRVSVVTALWGRSRRLSSGKRLHFGLTNLDVERRLSRQRWLPGDATSPLLAVPA